MIKKRIANLPSNLYFEIITICSMSASLLIQPQVTPIAAWTDLSTLSFVRAAIWLLGLLTLPGIFVVRLLGISRRLSRISNFAVAVNLSFVLISVITLVFYSANWSFSYLPITFLIITVLLAIISWLRSRNNLKMSPLDVRSSSIALLALISIVILFAFFVQVNERYLIPGDNWVSLKPAVSIVAQRNVFESVADLQYPPMFGFIMAGLAVCSGFPIVNVYVVLFPLVGLNILTFSALLETVFHVSRKINFLSCALYAFGGGLGWLIQILVYGGAKDFWTLSQVSQDMYFSVFFWSSIQFSYKSLAITLAFASLIAYSVNVKEESKRIRFALLSISALMLLFSFLIHMLEAVIFVPLVLGIAFLYQKGRRRFVDLGVLSVTGVVAILVLDILMKGFYFSLVIAKAQLFLSSINSTGIILFLSLIVGIGAAFLAFKLYIPKHSGFQAISGRKIGVMKLLIAASLLTVYVAGLLVWISFPVYDLSAGFPWYRFVTRYGFIGGLAIVGLTFVSWREKSVLLTFLWCIIAIGLGSTWWGERTNGYLFPMLALLSAFAIFSIWEKTKDKKIGFILEKEHAVIKQARINLKPLSAIFLVAVIALSSTSVIYGAYYYASISKATNDDLARTFLWIAQNTPPNSTIVVPETYEISRGIQTISDRRIIYSSAFPQSSDSPSFENLTQLVSTNGIEYVVTTESVSGTDSVLNSLIFHSRLVFQSGEYSVFKIPEIHPASTGGIVAVVDRERFGLYQSDGFGWVDDSFAQNWTSRDGDIRSDGELLTYSWQFKTGNTTEPSMKITGFQVNSNQYPYLIIKYRNTQLTTDTAKDNIYQIVTPYNETGPPNGYIKNVFLPVALTSGFDVTSQELPENQNITSIVIWMRNPKNLTGSVELQIDYLGFAENESLATSQTQPRFLSMMLPALWHVNYSIVNSFDETSNARIIVSQYDNSVYAYILNSTTANGFVFVNSTASIPLWGSEWRQVASGIISGLESNRKVVIVASSTLENNISKTAEIIYSSLFPEGS